MNFELEQSTENDYNFCYDLTKENMYDLFCKHWGGWVDSEFQKGFNVECIKIIKIDKTQVGYLSCIKEGESIYLDNIQITQKFQNKGLGTTIIKRLIAEHHSQKIKLTTFEDNPAKRLYDRLGFKVIEKNGSTIKMEKIAQQKDTPDLPR